MVGIVDGGKVVALPKAGDTDAGEVRDILSESLAWTVDNPCSDVCVFLVARDGTLMMKTKAESVLVTVGMLEMLKLELMAGL